MKKIKQHPVIATGFLVVILALAFTFAAYKFGWDWTGFIGGGSQITTTSTSHGITTATVKPAGKTLWDWLELLIVPLVLAVGAFWLNQIQKSREERTAEQRAEIERKAAEERAKTEREIAADNQREAALQAGNWAESSTESASMIEFWAEGSINPEAAWVEPLLEQGIRCER